MVEYPPPHTPRFSGSSLTSQNRITQAFAAHRMYRVCPINQFDIFLSSEDGYFIKIVENVIAIQLSCEAILGKYVTVI